LTQQATFSSQAILQIAYMGLGFSNWWVLLVHTGPSTTKLDDTLFLYWQKGNCSKMGFFAWIQKLVKVKETSV
jgi:hypothetical protein